MTVLLRKSHIGKIKILKIVTHETRTQIHTSMKKSTYDDFSSSQASKTQKTPICYYCQVSKTCQLTFMMSMHKMKNASWTRRKRHIQGD